MHFQTRSNKKLQKVRSKYNIKYVTSYIRVVKGIMYFKELSEGIEYVLFAKKKRVR